MNESTTIRMIPITQLYHHPDNPRRDIGDVTELAASIEAKGIMQNLTVVPGHYADIDEYVRISKAEGVSKAAAKEMYKQLTAEERYLSDGYTVVIGNRRLEASRLAGLTELPCAVSDMDVKDQLATMLAENMQRADLTMPEQVAGIQMCLDLGMSDSEVMKQTGFSRKTYNSRRKLSCVSASALKQGSDDGLTIEDFIRLADLEEKGRKEIEDSIGKLSTDVLRGRITNRWMTMKAHEWRGKYCIPYCQELGAAKGNFWRSDYEDVKLARWVFDSPATLTEKYFESQKPTAEQLELGPDELLYYEFYDWSKEIALYKKVKVKKGTKPKTAEEIKKEKAEKAKIELSERQLALAEEIKVRHMEWIKANWEKINERIKTEGVSNDQVVLELMFDDTGIKEYLKRSAHNYCYGEGLDAVKQRCKLRPESIFAQLLDVHPYMHLSWPAGALPEIKVLRAVPHYYSFCAWFGMWHEKSKLFAWPEWIDGKRIYRFAKDGLREAQKYYENLQELGYEPAEDEKLLLEWKHPLIRGKGVKTE